MYAGLHTLHIAYGHSSHPHAAAAGCPRGQAASGLQHKHADLPAYSTCAQIWHEAFLLLAAEEFTVEL
jgi:hypothetical protein